MLKRGGRPADAMGMTGCGMRVRSLRGCQDDAGVTMVELVAAMSVFAIVAVGVAYGLNAAILTGRGDRMRVQAAQLAAREVEIVRNEFTASPSGPTNLGATSQVTNPHPLPGGTTGQPLVIDGNPFTVVRTVEWLPAGTGESPCDGGSAVTYPSLSVNVRVTWPQMGGIRPVVSNTVLTPPKTTVSSNLGFIAVKVVGAAGTGLPDVPVSVAGPASMTRVTAADGCAVFALSSLGTYTATLNVTGMVSFDGHQSVSKSVAVAAGTLKQLPFSYDLAVGLSVTMAAPDGYAIPTPRPGIRLYNPGIQPFGHLDYAATGTTTVLSGLWPFTDGYSVWAGSCDQSDPSGSGGQRPTPVVVAGGSSGIAQAPLAPLDITVVREVDDVTTPVAGAVVVARPASTAGCLGGESTLTLGTTDATGLLRSSLPAGVWELTSGSSDPVATPPMLPGGAAVPVALEVT